MKKAFLILLLLIPALCAAKVYKGAEYRTKGTFLYGRFDVRMKSAQREGMLSSFFTYHEISSIDDWNEIDIEILGRYDDDVQFNPITPGQVNHVSHYRTPFNPALDFHTYGFEWTPDYVAWFVDGEEVHRQTGAHIQSLNLPQKIMMNVWNPEYENWAGTWNDAVLPAFAMYDWVRYSSYTPGSGTSGTGNNFTQQWQDDFDSWDQSRWEKGTHTWGGNGCDFVQENAVFKDGNLILCLTKEGATGYTDAIGPTALYARTEAEWIRMQFSEEVDSAIAVDPSHYIITGKSVSSVALLPDRKTVLLTVAPYDTATIGSVIVTGIKDTFIPSNTSSAKNVTLIKTSPLTFPVKINCGGPAANGYRADQTWGPSVEYGRVDGALYSNTKTVSGTPDAAVFNTELNGAVEYRLRVPNGTYSMILMMAENYFTSAQQRIFSIWVNGTKVETNLDLYQKIGLSKAYQKSIQGISVTDGIIDIHWSASVNNGLINGIQLYRTSTGMERPDRILPEEWHLGQNFPNPFNGGTMIPLEVREPGEAVLRVYDSAGRTVREMELGRLNTGAHIVRWNGRDDSGAPMASGVYYYQLSGGGMAAARKMVLLQ